MPYKFALKFHDLAVNRFKAVTNMSGRAYKVNDRQGNPLMCKTIKAVNEFGCCRCH